jgi:leucine dehydrogenase
MFEELIRSWDGEAVVSRFDRPTGTWMFVGIHSTDLGPAGGGTRLRAYDAPADGLADAMNLAGAMTLKMAAAGMPFGGGKAVLAVPGPLDPNERRGLFERYGDLIASLGGTYQTGPDMNTSVADMDVIGERTQFVCCRSEARGGSGDPGPATAVGVFHGIRASVGHALGSDDLEGRSVLVQGLGDVGARLAEQLAIAGARVLVSDIDAGRAATTAERLGAENVAPEEAIAAECDVYAPCAVGGTVNATSIPLLRCRIVAGCANNQLAEPEDAARLRAAGILYAPDFVINAGGVLYAWGGELLGWSPETIAERHRAIGDTLVEIYERAEAEDVSTHEAAERLARSRRALEQRT